MTFSMDGKPETSQAVPTTPDEHFAWWRANTDVPYGTWWCGCGQRTSLAPTNQAWMREVGGQPRRYISGEAAITLLPADA
jgi:hypothetical protein